MAGGGMGFIFEPSRKPDAQDFLNDTMTALQRELRHALPFAMEPVVYDFAINPHGTFAADPITQNAVERPRHLLVGRKGRTAARGKALQDATLAEMDDLWNAAKADEKAPAAP